MAPSAQQVTRRVGMALFLGFLGLIVVGSLIREPWHRDGLFVLVRWPVWVIGGVLAPLVCLRVVLWRRGRAARAAAAPGAAPDSGAPDRGDAP